MTRTRASFTASENCVHVTFGDHYWPHDGARRLRARPPRPGSRWHLDEMVAVIGGTRVFLWRAVDHEGEVLEFRGNGRVWPRQGFGMRRELLALPQPSRIEYECRGPNLMATNLL